MIDPLLVIPPTTTRVDPLEDALSASFELHRSYPNPFNPTTTIAFQVAQSSVVSLKIFDVPGREIATPVSGFQSDGSNKYSIRCFRSEQRNIFLSGSKPLEYVLPLCYL